MRHVVLTRSAYGDAWDLDANRRRLDMTLAVTIPTMRAQTSREWEWIVAIDVADPLASERMAAFCSAGVPVRFLEVRTSGTRQQAASDLYRAPWATLLGPRDVRMAMTRLDDDDGLAPWALEKIRSKGELVRERMILMIPRGIRVWDGRWTPVHHRSNAMHTLVAQPGDPLHVYAYLHRKVARVAPVREIDTRFGWLWARHADTISGWHAAASPITPRVRAMFPIDWSVFGAPTARPVTGGSFFR